MPAVPDPAFRNDIHRPSYHFLPAANWMNDPNGVIQWRGRYHLFFQYNPDGAYHANMHWGHAISDDLLHWQELPIAIAPTPNSPDRGGIWSGSVVNDNGSPVAFYTGVNDDYSVQTQCMARGNQDLTRWEKFAGNPVIGDPPDSLGQTQHFRDPYVWREDSAWYMTLSTHIVGVGGVVLLYRSADLIDWDYLGPLYIGEKARSGRNFELSNFFRLGDKCVLIISMQADLHPTQTIYLVGSLENHCFIPEREMVYDVGDSYASLVHRDESGRTLIYSWIREGRSFDLQYQCGWTGVQAIPRVLSLDAKNRLVSQPVPEIQALRGSSHHFSADDLTGDVLSVRGLSLDIDATFDANAAECCGIEVALSADGREGVAITYDRGLQTLLIHRRYAGPAPGLDCAPEGIPHPLDADEDLQLRVLLDGSVIEVIANGRSRITSRFYPTDAENQGLRVLGAAALKHMDIWELSSIW